ncbi:MAG: GT4 family glycosyltransferase PelF, partial [Noviherbaspirillum sp.]
MTLFHRTDKSLTRRAADCDVMLLLEGTFPFVSGGVSSWVNQIIRAFPDLRFGICFIGSRREDYDGARYPLPDNVVHFEDHYLHEKKTTPPARRKARGDDAAFAQMAELHQALRTPHRSRPDHQSLSAGMAALL